MTGRHRFVAFLRGVNAGRRNALSMAALVHTFQRLGYDDARTYVNSGNIIFSAVDSDADTIGRQIEVAIEKDTGLHLDVLLVRDSDVARIAVAIPDAWVDDTSMKCDVMLLWRDVDERSVLERLPINPDIDDVLYVPGAVVWRIDRTNANRSRMRTIVGTPLYKRMTIRNPNTIRRLDRLLKPRPGGGAGERSPR